MSSKAQLNAQVQHWQTQAAGWKAKCDWELAKNKKLNERLARRRNGLWRRLWLRAKAILRGKH